MMTREIRFRAWVEEVKLMLPVTDIDFEGKSIGCIDSSTQWFDQEYLLMQYTGLKDKNGTYIYEGDIVDCRSYGRWGVTVVEVYDMVEFSVMLNFAFGGEDDSPENLEVLGNIYENPELLEATK